MLGVAVRTEVVVGVLINFCYEGIVKLQSNEMKWCL